MQGTRPPTFRPTPAVWPAEPPDARPVRRYRLVPVEGTGALVHDEVLDEAPLPPDFVLRELLADDALPTTAEDVAAFTQRWGLAGWRGDDSLGDLPWVRPLEDEATELDEWLRSTGDEELIHPAVVTWHVRVARALARHTLAYLEGRDGDLAGEWRREVGNQAPVDNIDAWVQWAMYMNAGLQAFTVHVRLADGDPAWGAPRVSLYNACCLQLAQYVASEAHVARCANERCRQPFTRQRGRARDDYGQHRSRGVKYCSHLCAKAQSERDRRRRRSGEGDQ